MYSCGLNFRLPPLKVRDLRLEIEKNEHFSKVPYIAIFGIYLGLIARSFDPAPLREPVWYIAHNRSTPHSIDGTEPHLQFVYRY